MKGNSGRLKRTSRQWKLLMLVLGLLTPLALYWMVNGGGGDGVHESKPRGRSNKYSGIGVAGGINAYRQGTLGVNALDDDVTHDRSGSRGAGRKRSGSRVGEERREEDTETETRNGAHHATHSRIGDRKTPKKTLRNEPHGASRASTDSPPVLDYGTPKREGGLVTHKASAGGSSGMGKQLEIESDTKDSEPFDDDLVDEPTLLTDEQCVDLANEWVEERRAIYTQHTHAASKAVNSKKIDAGDDHSDLLFFLHIPRTAGRTFHFCYLKLAVPEKKRCGKSYDQLRVNVHNPQCNFLASHDDYSLVERFHEQPQVVTMFRDPVARFLSSYEFAVEVSVRSFGTESTAPSSRVSTRNVWPWSNAVRFIDKDLRRYKDRVEKNEKQKESIENVYNNTVYTPLHEFVDTPEALENFHNAQFLQLLGLSTNSNPETEPKAAELRSCLRKESEATDILYRYAEERLEREIDVTVTHERLDDALRMTSAEFGLPMSGPSYNGVNHAPAHSKILLNTLTVVAKHGARLDTDENTDFSSNVPGNLKIVGFTFRFGKVTIEQLKDDKWRQGYLDAVTAVLAYRCGVEQKNVKVTPPSAKLTWAKDEGGWQTALVEFPTGLRGRVEDEFTTIDDLDVSTVDPDSDPKQKLTPVSLLKILKKARDDETNAYQSLVSQAQGFEEYGEMTVHALGVVNSDTRVDKQVEVYELGNDPTFVPLGQAFRTCERAQRNKYARLKKKAFQSLHKHVLGDFEPFVKDDRGQIGSDTLSQIRDLNFLDDKLHKFAKELFDRRYEEKKESIQREALPEKLQN